MCQKVRKIYLEVGYTAVSLEIPAGEVAGAAVETQGREDWSTLYIEGWAIALSGIVYAVAKSEFFFNSVGKQMLPVAFPTVYTPLDKNVRVGAIVETCDADDPPMMRWMWRPEPEPDGWKAINAPTWPRLVLPISQLDGPGNYVIRGSLLDDSAKVEILFDIEILPLPPPTATLYAPAVVATTCGALLDASHSRDPGGAPLTFHWSCSPAATDGTDMLASPSLADLEACTALAAGASDGGGDGSVLELLPGTLGPGRYDFSVLVAREDANATQNATVEVVEVGADDSPPPVVTIAAPPVEVSPQRPFELLAEISTTSACGAPEWQAWWILNISDDGEPQADNSTALLLESETPAPNAADDAGIASAISEVQIAPPWLVPPGRYILRLVLSTAPGAHPFSPAHHVFDSVPLVVDMPPIGGECLVYPRAGNATLTPFRLGSLNWVDDDLPLMHRFTWRMESADASGPWIALNPWSLSEELRPILFGSAGGIVVKAEAKDTLGSISSAEGTAVIVKPRKLPEESDLLKKLDVAAAIGEPYVMLNSATSVAATMAEAGGGSPQLCMSLLGNVEKSGALDDPSNEAVSASTAVMMSVLDSENAMSTAKAKHLNMTGLPAVDFEVAAKSTELISKIASAGRGLDEGLEQKTAGTLLGSMGTMMRTLAVNPEVTSGAIGMRGPPLDAEEETKLLRWLSDQMHKASSEIGTAVMKAAKVGESVNIGSEVGPRLALHKADPDIVGGKGVFVGSFVIPPLGEALAESINDDGRRLEGCLSDGVILQETIWPSNIVGYMGTRGSAATMPRPSLPVSYTARKGVEAVVNIDEDCCDIAEDTIVSMEIVACGRVAKLTNLSSYIKFEVPLASRPTLSDNLTETRVCQYLNTTSQAWTDEGCYVEALLDDSVICSCNHLSSFTAGFGSFVSTFKEVIYCANVEVLSTTAFTNLERGGWQSRAASVIYQVVVVSYFVLALISLNLNCWRQKKLGVRRHQFLEMLASEDREDEERKAQGSLKRMQRAAAKNGKTAFLAKALWWLNYKVFGIIVAPFEECMMRNTIGGLGIALTIQQIKETTIRDVGLTRNDVQGLMQCKGLKKMQMDASITSLASAQLGIEGVLDAYATVLGKAREDFVGSSKLAKHLRMWSLFLTHHPIVQLVQPSITVKRSLQLVAVAMNLFGTLGTSALFFIASDWTYNLASADECSFTGVGARLARDIWVVAISSFFAFFPPLTLIWVHSRTRPYREDKQMRRNDSYKRACEDNFMILVGLVYSGWWVFLTFSFLANVSETDANDWLIAFSLHFLKAWFAAPFCVALVWHNMVKLVFSRPRLVSDLGEVMEALLATERAVSKSKIYSYDEDGRPILRPAWLDGFARGATFHTDKAQDVFNEWADYIAQTSPPISPPPMEAMAAMSGARMLELPPGEPGTMAITDGRAKEEEDTLKAAIADGNPKEEEKAAEVLAVTVPPNLAALQAETPSRRRSEISKISRQDSCATIRPETAEDKAYPREDPVCDLRVPIEVAPTFNTWAEEWYRMQPEGVDLLPRETLPTGLHSTLPLSPMAHRSFEKRAHRLGLRREGTRVIDGRQPVAFTHQVDTPTWVTEWRPPPKAPTSPLSAWSTLADRQQPSRTPKAKGLQPPKRLALSTSSKGHLEFHG